MKTTLNLNDNLVKKAKLLATEQGTTLTRLIEDGLQLRLRGQRRAKHAAIKLPVLRGSGGLQRGLNARSNKSLLDAADDDA